jgi:hypothetical protein
MVQSKHSITLRAEVADWWKNYQTCVEDQFSYYLMKNYCGSILQKILPMTIELIDTNGYGVPNIYCKWIAKVPTDSESVTLNFTRLVYSTLDKFSFETVYQDGGSRQYRNIISTQYVFPAEQLSQINIHYYTTVVHDDLPFTINIFSTEQGFSNFVGLFIALGVIIAVCVFCSIFFYKYSKVIIENNRRIQEQRANELAAMNNNENRQEELKKVNKDILSSMFENELKPCIYTEKFNDFNIPQCTVCLEDFNTEIEVVKLNCKHIFHFVCLKDWLEKILLAPKCPCCNDYIILMQKQDYDDNLNSSRMMNANNATMDNNNNVLVLNNNIQNENTRDENANNNSLNDNNNGNANNNNNNNPGSQNIRRGIITENNVPITNGQIQNSDMVQFTSPILNNLFLPRPSIRHLSNLNGSLPIDARDGMPLYSMNEVQHNNTESTVAHNNYVTRNV